MRIPESMSKNLKKLSPEEQSGLLNILKTRFGKHPGRHEGISWDDVEKKLLENPEKLWSIHEMELTEGEPDVIAYDSVTNEYIFCDCSAESPKGRRSLCYDQAALDARKEHKPENSAVAMAFAMGIELLSETAYRELQKLGKFDQKTSSWVQTPAAVRELDGALFCDRRYNQVFLYHNGASSYYAARGFRGTVRV